MQTLRQRVARLLRDPEVGLVIHVAEDGTCRTLASRKPRPGQAVCQVVFTGPGVPA